VETRYPGHWGEISSEEIGHALALAQESLNWAEGMIGSVR